MNTNLSFITNEKKQSLKERFSALIKNTSFFDCLVGYFYSSGFFAVYPALENTDKIRILNTNKFRYARYMPMMYYEGKIDKLKGQSQCNLKRFMKILLENEDGKTIKSLTEEEIKIVEGETK
jgi:hypothetical protein